MHCEDRGFIGTQPPVFGGSLLAVDFRSEVLWCIWRLCFSYRTSSNASISVRSDANQTPSVNMAEHRAVSLAASVPVTKGNKVRASVVTLYHNNATV